MISNLKPKTNSLTKTIHNLFSIDYRALRIFRIALGILVIADQLLKLPNFSAFFSDAGFLPREVLIRNFNVERISLNMASGDVVFQYILSFIIILLAIFLILGIKSRITTFFIWLILLSFQNRNPFILNSGDVLFRMLCFWAIFLPLDEYKLKLIAAKRKKVISVGSIAILLQTFFVFFFAGVLKTGSEWTTTFEASWNAMNITLLATPIGRFLTKFPELLKFTSFVVQKFEVMGSLLLFFPIFTKYIRILIVPALAGMVFGFSLGIHVGLFPYYCMTGLVLFLPSEVFDLINNVILRFSKNDQDRFIKDWWLLKQGITFYKKFTQIPFRLKSYVIRLISNHSTYSPLDSMNLNFIALIFLIVVISWNLTALPNNDFRVSQPFYNLGLDLGLDQKWNMFAPTPANVHGWYVIEGTLANGQEINVLNPAAKINTDKTDEIGPEYWEQSWRKFFVDYLHNTDYSYLLDSYSTYLCSRFNYSQRDSTKLLKQFKIHYFEQSTLSGMQLSGPQDIVLKSKSCY